MAEKVYTFVNKSHNPVKMRNGAGEVVLVPVGEAIEVDDKGAVLAARLGMVDFSKMTKPSVAVAELQKENADLKAKLAAAEKEIAQLKEDLEITKL